MKRCTTTLAMLLLLVTACGGGGSSSSSNDTETTTRASPTPASAPAPTDAPAAGPSPSSFPTLRQALTTGAGVSTYQNQLYSDGGRIRIEPDLSLTVLGFADRRTFPVEVDPDKGLRRFESSDGSRILYRSLPEAPAHGVELQYVSYGAWIDGDFPFDNVFRQGGVFYVGTAPFQPGGRSATRQTSGVARYAGGAIAFEYNSDQGTRRILDTLSGPMRATADFDLSRVSIEIDLERDDGQPWGSIASESLRISTWPFSGNVTSTNGHWGNMGGHFWGPDSQEIAGTFNLLPRSRESPNFVRGVFGGAKTP